MNDDDEDFDSAAPELPEAVLMGLTEVFNMAASVADLQQDEVAQEEMYGLINSLADFFGIEYTIYGQEEDLAVSTNIKHSGADAEPRLPLLETSDETVYLPDREFADDDDDEDDEDARTSS